MGVGVVGQLMALGDDALYQRRIALCVLAGDKEGDVEVVLPSTGPGW